MIAFMIIEKYKFTTKLLTWRFQLLKCFMNFCGKSNNQSGSKEARDLFVFKIY